MPSHLRNQTSFPTHSIYPTIIQPTPPLPSPKRQKMSITQAYYLAQSARGKLSTEASRADHDLRLLVGHANLLDSLMLELADAEREQESWFNQTVNGAAKASAEPKHIMWADSIAEETEEEIRIDSSDSDSDSEYDEDDEMDIAVPAPLPARRAPSPPAYVTTIEVDSDDSDDDYPDDGIEDYSELTLTRTSSAHPPELSHESDSDSDDDSMPPSPPQPNVPMDAFSEKQRQAIATTSFYEKQASSTTASLSNSEQASFFEEGFYLPRRQPPTEQQAAMISAY